MPARQSEVEGRVIFGELLLLLSSSKGLPLPPDVACDAFVDDVLLAVLLAVDSAAMTEAGVEVAISRPLVVAVASIGATVSVDTTTSEDDDNNDDDDSDEDDDDDSDVADAFVANVVLLATSGALVVSTIRALVLTAAEPTTIVLDPIVGVAVVDTATVAELATEVSLPALGQRSVVPLPARNAVMVLSPVTPALAHDFLTDWVNALSAAMHEVEHFEVVKSDPWQALIWDV